MSRFKKPCASRPDIQPGICRGSAWGFVFASWLLAAPPHCYPLPVPGSCWPCPPPLQLVQFLPRFLVRVLPMVLQLLVLLALPPLVVLLRLLLLLHCHRLLVEELVHLELVRLVLALLRIQHLVRTHAVVCLLVLSTVLLLMAACVNAVVLQGKDMC